MSKASQVSSFKRLRNRYRLVVMNDDTYEEVVTFKLSRISVYIMLSSIFVILVSLTVALVMFTPLKYYIPGYGAASGGMEYRSLKYKVDSLEKQMGHQIRYIDNIRDVLSGDTKVQLDTTILELPKVEISND